MPPKKAAAAAAPVAPGPPPPPPDPLVLYGPDVSSLKPAVKSVFRLFDPAETGAVLVGDCVPMLHALRVYVTDKEFRELVLPELNARSSKGGATATSPQTQP